MGIVKHRRYTNKDFKDNFVDLASNKPKSGHLTKQKNKDKTKIVEGVLKHIIIDRIDANGWVVEVGSGSERSTYNCTNPQWSLSIPSSTQTATMYVPNKKTRVEFSMDKEHKIYTIIRVIGGKSAFSNYQDVLKISVDQNDKTNQDVNAEITMTSQDVQIDAKSIIINSDDKQIDLIKTQENHEEQIKTLTQENNLLKEKINQIEEKLNGAE